MIFMSMTTTMVSCPPWLQQIATAYKQYIGGQMEIVSQDGYHVLSMFPLFCPISQYSLHSQHPFSKPPFSGTPRTAHCATPGSPHPPILQKMWTCTPPGAPPPPPSPGWGASPHFLGYGGVGILGYREGGRGSQIFFFTSESSTQYT